MNSRYITDDLRSKLSWKEQDFLNLVKEKDYTRSELQRKLYIHSKSGFFYFKKNLITKIKNSISNKTY